MNGWRTTGIVRLAAVATATALLGGLIAGCAATTDGPTTSREPGSLEIVATTTLLADLATQVAGPGASVSSLVPKGGEVHTFDPRPSDLRAVSEARVILMNGLGLDDWLGRIAADTASGATIVRLGEDLDGVTYLSGDDEDHPVNPHLWLDVRIASRYVERIEAALAAADPDGAAGYRERAAAYRARLAELDGWVRERIATIPEADRSFVSFHDALPYYAAAYGLRIVGVVVPAPGQEPSAGEVAALVAAIRESGVKAIFSESQFDPSLAAALADEAGASVVADLYTDTLGDPPLDTFEGVIRWDTERFVEALR